MAEFEPDREGPSLYAVLPGRPFFDEIVKALLRDFGDDLGVLPSIRIFVPSRRSARALKEAFVRHAPKGVILLPRITATADLSEDDFPTGDLVPGALLSEAPAAAVKRLKLAGIYDKAKLDAGDPVSWHGALMAAGQLSQTSDMLADHGITADDLEALAEAPELGEGAKHWQSILSVLTVVTKDYPRWLAGEGMVDGRVRRAQLLARLGEALARDRSRLILAAGFLGTSPPTEAFLKTVAGLDNGAVVLPALDQAMTDEAWETIEAPHPQSAYKALLEKTFDGLPRSAVRLLGLAESEGAARRELLSMALMPARSTHHWAEAFSSFRERQDAGQALEGLKVAVARTSDEEADFIALKLRSVLEEEGKSAYLVTADRLLGRRVAAKLEGWGIEIDDSGGAPLRGSFRATFLRLIARVMAEPSDAVALAGLIHHQLFGLGMKASDRRPLVAAFDRFLRGRRPREGWDGLAESLTDEWRAFPGKANREDDAVKRCEELLVKLREVFLATRRPDEAPVAQRLEVHLAIAEALAATDSEEGRERLYRFEDGEVLRPHLEQLLAHPDLLGQSSAEDYPDIFDTLLDGPSFRPPGGQHPRLSVYGVLEARLQTADLVIVGGLQEGVWPGDAAVDPFLSRSMRAGLGLPSPDAEIGRVAHDFLDFAAQPEVLLTRAERRGRSPQRASRLMLRLESFLKELDKDGTYDETAQLRAWAAGRFAHEGRATPAKPPRPNPPVDKRPDRLSVSNIGTWLRDPYAIYGDKVLGLRKFRSYDEPFGSRERGDVLHKLFEVFIQGHLEDPVDEIEEELERRLDFVLDAFDVPEEQRLLNSKFLTTGLKVFAAQERKLRERGHAAAIEERGEMALKAGGRDITLRAVADRIDLFTDGGGHIIDYKLGGQASLAEAEHFSPQLFLCAMMLREGCFDPPGAVEPEQISFLRMKFASGEKIDELFPAKVSAKKGQRISSGELLADQLATFERNFYEWLEVQYKDGTPFLSQVRPFKSGSAGDYDELARRSEWAEAQGDDD
ncbi:double-strand break repair protein AddB [Parvularcula sp. ZS-1/3]|uniref:Double-strand break repair protein AddB n=1 Tax=Parvularcula mediterranea TaxID=2732508 RepID=A0A7Y3RM24_9PROT|nr:double-strand break repair protein AddB [Parvularcula mediterranea]NNU16095.1 double-strand break repair protein AddB [Parvularcula mediterranea]